MEPYLKSVKKEVERDPEAKNCTLREKPFWQETETITLKYKRVNKDKHVLLRTNRTSLLESVKYTVGFVFYTNSV